MSSLNKQLECPQKVIIIRNLRLYNGLSQRTKNENVQHNKLKTKAFSTINQKIKLHKL